MSGLWEWAPQTTVHNDGGGAAGFGRMKGGRFGLESVNPENSLTEKDVKEISQTKDKDLLQRL